MTQESMQTILARWLHDDAFRTEMFWNADGTMHRTHLPLDWEEFSTLRAINWKSPPEELRPQIDALVQHD